MTVFVKVTRISETELRAESLRGIIGYSPALERVLGRMKRRGCEIRRTGHAGMAYIKGSVDLIGVWNSKGFKIGDSLESS
jgi:hypothetical protein